MMVRSHALTLVKFQPRLFVVSLRKPDSYFNQDWLTEDMPIYASSHAEAVRVAVGIHFGPRPPAKPETVVASVKIPGSQWHSVRADSSGWVDVGGLPYLVSPSAPNSSDSSQGEAEDLGPHGSLGRDAQAAPEADRSPLQVAESCPLKSGHSVQVLLQSILVEARRAGASGQLETLSVLQECAAYLLSAEAQRANSKVALAELRRGLSPVSKSSSSSSLGAFASSAFDEGGNTARQAEQEKGVA